MDFVGNFSWPTDLEKPMNHPTNSFDSKGNVFYTWFVL